MNFDHWNPRWSSQVSFQMAHLKRDMNFDYRRCRLAFRRAFRVASFRDRAVSHYMLTHTANVAKEPYIPLEKRDVADQRAVSHYMHTHTAIYVSYTYSYDTTHYMHAHTANVAKEPYIPLTKEMLPTNGLDCTTCTLIPRMLQKSPIYP